MSSPVQASHPNLGSLPDVVEGLARRLRLGRLESRHNSRLIIGLYVMLNSALTIGLLAVVAVLTQEPFIFPSLGPTAFILFFSALSAQACPRNVFCGQLIAVVAGILALAMFGLLTLPPDIDSLTWSRVGAILVAMCLTFPVMIWLGVPHAPAGATTLIVACGVMNTPRQGVILMVAVVVLLAEAMIINRLAGLPYPWWSPVKNAPPPVSE